MIANQLNDGQFFRLVYRGQPSKYDETDVLECVDENRPADWMRYPGILYRNARTGLHGGLGGANEIELCTAIEPVESVAKQEWQSMDISSGFGIGGAGSDDYSMATESAGLMSADAHGCTWHGTRYEENCASCGKFSFEICNACDCCPRCHGMDE